jgi:hypothetical protein
MVLCVPTQRVLLKVEAFDRITGDRGLKSDNAKAKHLGVSHTTIGRLRAGGAAGGRFIALALDRLAVPFESIFERQGQG